MECIAVIVQHEWMLFFGVYAVSLVTLRHLNRREFKRCPEKGERYKALPLRYKLACWLFVVPLFAGTLLQPALFLGGMLSFMFVEAACVRWYRKAGLW